MRADDVVNLTLLLGRLDRLERAVRDLHAMVATINAAMGPQGHGAPIDMRDIDAARRALDESSEPTPVDDNAHIENEHICDEALAGAGDCGMKPCREFPVHKETKRVRGPRIGDGRIGPSEPTIPAPTEREVLLTAGVDPDDAGLPPTISLFPCVMLDGEPYMSAHNADRYARAAAARARVEGRRAGVEAMRAAVHAWIDSGEKEWNVDAAARKLTGDDET